MIRCDFRPIRADWLCRRLPPISGSLECADKVKTPSTDGRRTAASADRKLKLSGNVLNRRRDLGLSRPSPDRPRRVLDSSDVGV